jgi:hypothetical protein
MHSQPDCQFMRRCRQYNYKKKDRQWEHNLIPFNRKPAFLPFESKLYYSNQINGHYWIFQHHSAHFDFRIILQKYLLEVLNNKKGTLQVPSFSFF